MVSENRHKRITELWEVWGKGVFMFIALFSGVALAIGHHLFHAHLNGKPVSSTTQQQWYGRVSVGFAQLVKFSFKLAIKLAAVQALWYGLKSKVTDIRTIDYLMNLAANPKGFLKKGVWEFSFPLAIILLLSWFLAYATVIAPPTLGVTLIPAVAEMAQHPVPQLNFENGPGENSWWEGVTPVDPVYQDPSIDFRRLAAITASSGSIQAMIPTWPNSSYELTFFGPNMKCQPQFLPNINQFASNNTGTSWVYYASALKNFSTIAEQLAAVANTLPVADGNTVAPSVVNSPNYMALNISDPAPVKFFIYFIKYPGENETFGDLFSNGTEVHECVLYNTSYHLQFDYTNSQQTITVVSQTDIGPVNDTIDSLPDRSQLYENPGTCLDDYNGTNTQCAYYDQVTKFTTVYHSVTQLLAGYLGGTLSGGEGINGETSLFGTGLIYTEEFEPWREDTNYPTPPEFLHLNNMTLIDAVEQLVLNVTLSLFTKSQFIQTNPPSVPVSVFAQQLIYDYHPMDLAIGYTVAGGFTLIAVCFGALNMLRNGSVHSNSFSSIVRASRNPELDRLIRAEDTDGSNPVPEYLKNTKIQLKPIRENGVSKIAFALIGNGPQQIDEGI